MSNQNPFVPKGSLLEQQSHSRSRLKLAVFCVVAVGTLGLVAMLIQGCKRDTSATDNPLPTIDTNTPPPMLDTNTAVNPPMDMSNQPPINVPPTSTNLPPVLPPQNPIVVPPVVDVPPTAAGAEYRVVAGDSLSKIAKKNHVTLKDLQTANPGVDSKHLKVGQKLVIPGGSSATTAAPNVAADAGASDETGSATTYTVKSGDNLHKIATKNHVSVKAIQTANHLTTTSIKVGQKLKIPASKTHKATTAPAEPAPVPAAAPADITPPPASTVPPTTVPSAPAPTTPPTR